MIKKQIIKKNVKKSISLNAAFKQVFGEALEPLGFKLIKSKYPYFVRVVEGGEIIHVITINKGCSFDNDFRVLSGIATIYRQRITLDESPSYNSIWLHRIDQFYRKLHSFDENSKYSCYDLVSFYYCDEKPVIHPLTGKLCEYSLIQAMEYAFGVTKKFVIPILDKVTDINSCIEHFRKYGPSMHLYSEEEDYGRKYGDTFCNEGMIYTKRGCNFDFIDKYEGPSVLLQKYKALRFNILKDSNLCVKYHTELQNRKAMNTEILRSYGLEIKN